MGLLHIFLMPQVGSEKLVDEKPDLRVVELPSVPHCVGVNTLLRAGVERRDGGDLVGG
jgi:hypothetical protein